MRWTGNVCRTCDRSTFVSDVRSILVNGMVKACSQPTGGVLPLNHEAGEQCFYWYNNVYIHFDPKYFNVRGLNIADVLKQERREVFLQRGSIGISTAATVR